jgi:hypothetical protein
VLQANIHQEITLVLSDGGTYSATGLTVDAKRFVCTGAFSATVLSVDDEGFVYSVEENGTKNLYWTRFEAVVSVEPITSRPA